MRMAGSNGDAISSTLDRLSAQNGNDGLTNVDPLAVALHHLRMDGVFYCLSELSAPWGLTMPAMPDCLWFHVVTAGECTLQLSDGAVRTIRAGEVAVLPHGAGHVAADELSSPTPVVFDVPHHYISRSYATLDHGGGGPACTVVCGLVHLGHPAAQMLIDALPELILVDEAYGREHWGWLPSLMALIGAEASTMRPGGETVITRLSDVLVVQAIRAWIDTDPAAQTGWLQALRDPVIGRAINLVHGDPARDWTVATLAQEVGASRSNFSARFSELVGVAPKQYITTWRMQMAQDLLRQGDQTVAQVGFALGYSSEAAFSRAFRRETGVNPSAVRSSASARDLAVPPGP